MKITLYKKCILSNSYSEVFDVFHKTKDPLTNEETVALQRYLSSLTKYEITADNVYVPNSGKITLELDFDYENVSNNIYEYNYMYLEDTDNNFRRYCFIDDITVVNGLAVISFSEDIWSNYASSMEIRKSLLVRSRATKYGSWSIPFYAPGMAYEGNNQLKFNDIEAVDEEGNSIEGTEIQLSNTDNKNVALICQLQVYNLSQEGVISDRKVYTVAANTLDLDLSEYTFLFPLNTTTAKASVYEIVRQLYIKSSEKQFIAPGGDNTPSLYYQISNVLLLPGYFVRKQSTSILIGHVNITGSATCHFYKLDISIGNILSNDSMVFVKTLTLDKNFKRIGIGCITNLQPVVENGTSIEVKIGIAYDDFSVGVYLVFQNKIIEITNDFLLEIPISVQTADVTQQQLANRELKTMNAKLGIANAGIDIATGYMGAIINAGMIGLGVEMNSVLPATSYSGMSTGMKGAGGFASSINSVGKGITALIGSQKQLEVANRSMFATNKGTNINYNVMLNARFGIVIAYMQPDNESEVQANINNTGYVCNEIVDNLFNKPITDTVATAYNVMRFEFANIFGNFTQNIAKALRAILYSGFKIWYDETKINV